MKPITTFALRCDLATAGIYDLHPNAPMKSCRDCRHTVSDQAIICPQCGAPYPAKAQWNGWGFEYKTKGTVYGLPWLHISFKYTAERCPIPARGVIAIGQFACGILTVSQFGIGLISVSQFTLAGFALAQFALAYSLIAQFGLYIDQGSGQLVRSITEIASMF